MPNMKTMMMGTAKGGVYPNGFKIEVKTDNSGTSTDYQFTLPLNAALTYDFWVDWGEGGDVEHIPSSTSPTHTYDVIGTYVISISGTFPTIRFNDGGDRNKLLDIKQWGDIVWTSLAQSFYSCQVLTGTYTDTPNFLAVEDADDAFRECFALIGRANWDMPALLSARRMFRHSEYNGDLSEMIAINLETAQEFIEYVPEFNNKFFTAIPPNMTEAIRATSFDQDISGWDITRLTTGARCLDASPFSNANYDLALVSFASQAFNDNVPFHFGTAVCSAGAPQDAKDLLISHGWTITDGSV